jgi:uncharacterized membrane protein
LAVSAPSFASAVPPELPPLPAAGALPPPPEPAPAWSPEPAAPAINWEQFMGAKLFAWLGGVAAFLGIAFFVKYSFEHDLIPPEIRVAIGFLFAVGLVVGGLYVPRERHAITGQTLCGTGIVSLYAVTFACNSIYHFAFFGPLATFAVMSLITATAFVLAIRLDAPVVAILGMLGGFLTPVLLSTGHDNPPGLFGYLALLDLGLMAVALHRRWHYLVSLGAVGTIVMQFGWAQKFLTAEKAATAMVVCLGFCALFLAAYFVARRFSRASSHLTASAVAFPFVSLAFATVFLGYGTVAARPGLLFAFVFAADACLLALAWWDETMPKLHLIAGLAVFALLAAWTGSRLTDDLLSWALVLYLVYAAAHTAFPLLLERHRPDASPTWWSQLFPPLTLLLMMGPLFRLDGVSLAYWPCVLLIDLMAIGLAVLSASLAGVAAVLVLTLVVTGLWVFRVPVTPSAAPAMLLVIGGFALLFYAAGLYVSRRLGERLSAGEGPSRFFGDTRAQIPAFSALLPFLLLIMMTQRLPLANPSPVFGLGLLLAALTLGLAMVLAIEWLPMCALVGVGALEYAWNARHFSVEQAPLALGWFALFYGVFAGFPFFVRSRVANLTGPWTVAALAGVVQFPLVYQLVKRAWPNDIMGGLPALFVIAPLLSLLALVRSAGTNERARLNQLAWFGGVALLFITLIFPIQFSRQWLTVAWALEGAALIWLFHRVPHRGLRATGVVLLVAAFARLALNPAVLTYHARSSTPIFNWYLYTYGIAIACLFIGARWLRRPGVDPATPDEPVLGSDARPILNALGTVLAFLLLNLEIADYFTPAGARAITFDFSGNFARDMTYTIAWALFALGLLLVSFWQGLRAGRYAAIALLGIALLKLFFHDLARLEALYRIGALFAVAIIASLASFAYQRFLPGNEKPVAPKP